MTSVNLAVLKPLHNSKLKNPLLLHVLQYIEVPLTGSN